VIHISVTMKKYSTSQVAKMLGLQRPNLQRAIRQKRIPVPPLVKVGELEVRLWSDADVQLAREALGKRKKGKA
jgi:predicted DNA-binding transcriptional regulator AlpA